MLILSQDKFLLIDVKKIGIKKVCLYKKTAADECIPYDRFRIFGDHEFVLGDYSKIQIAQKILLKIGQVTAKGQLYMMPKDF